MNSELLLSFAELDSFVMFFSCWESVSQFFFLFKHTLCLACTPFAGILSRDLCAFGREKRVGFSRDEVLAVWDCD